MNRKGAEKRRKGERERPKRGGRPIEAKGRYDSMHPSEEESEEEKKEEA